MTPAPNPLITAIISIVVFWVIPFICKYLFGGDTKYM